MQLPVHEIADDLMAAMAMNQCARVLLKAPTGSGKSTAVPGMLIDAGIEGTILVIEPRRMAARLLAGWVAKQRRSRLGEEVGYAVRFDSRYGKSTRILYLTDGVFQRWLQDDPLLHSVGAVVFDEFHERRLAVDMALGRCLDLQDGTRPDLRVLVMSATLDTGGLAAFLAPVTTLEAGGRTFPVETIHLSDHVNVRDRSGSRHDTPVWEKIGKACREAMKQPDVGNILVFLPGMHEIRRTVELLKSSTFTSGWDVMPLHSSLAPDAQEAAIAPGARPKIIVATNVAETSLTIDGVRTVIDSGLARTARFETRRGINTLHIEPISRAAAEQRAGRAGRTAPGRAYRLWSANAHARRPEFETPEIGRVDLAEATLLLKAAGIGEIKTFRWLTPPDPAALERSQQLLHDLGALDAIGNITDDGRQMASLPLEPRFARLMLAGCANHCVAETAFIAAAVQGEPLFPNKGNGRKQFTFDDDHSDFAAEWRGFESACEMQFDPKRCQQIDVMARSAREIARGYERLLGIAKRFGWPLANVDFTHHHEAVGRAMLAAFSDHLAIRLNASTLACRLVGNRRAKLDDNSCTRNASTMVAAEITEVEGREVVTHMRRATVIDPRWLRDLFPDDFSAHHGAAWDDARRRVVARSESRFRDLIIDTNQSDHDVPIDQAAEILASKVIDGELILKNWDHSVEQWIARLSLLASAMPELELPGWQDDDQQAAIAQICHGAVSYKQIKEANPWPVLNEWLNYTQRAALDSYCPTRLQLANGNSSKITYERGKDPFISVKVAHLFGIWETPKIAAGRVPLLVHVLTPGQRPWQMTKDLNSFWENGYPQMKKELAGRYPRHPWPDDPKQRHHAG